jgi:hypothetical protein
MKSARHRRELLRFGEERVNTDRSLGAKTFKRKRKARKAAEASRKVNRNG